MVSNDTQIYPAKTVTKARLVLEVVLIFIVCHRKMNKICIFDLTGY